MSGNQNPGGMTKFVTLVAGLLLVYLVALLAWTFVTAVRSPEPHAALMGLLQTVVSGPAILGLLGVGAGVKYEDGIRVALARLGNGRSPDLGSDTRSPPASGR